jgi:hypothetical protein
MATGNELGLGRTGVLGGMAWERSCASGWLVLVLGRFGKFHERSALGGGGMGWMGTGQRGLVGNCIFAWEGELAFGGQGQAFDRTLLNSGLLLESRFGNASLFSAHLSVLAFNVCVMSLL